MDGDIKNKESSKFFFYSIFAASIYLTYLIANQYIGVMVLAVVTVMIFHPIFSKLVKWTRGRTNLSTGLTTIVILLTFIVPALLVTKIVYDQVDIFVSDAQDAVSQIEEFNIDTTLANIERYLNEILRVDVELNTDELIARAKSSISTISEQVVVYSTKAVTNTFFYVTAFFLYIVFVVTLLPRYENFYSGLAKISPLDDKLDKIYLSRILDMSKAMVKGTFVISATQAFVSCIFLWIAGVPYILFWFIILMVIGIVPFLGTSIVVLPIALIMLIQGDIGWAAFVASTNVLIVTQIDNIMRPMLVPKSAELHPALTIVGVLGGLGAFGVLGFIYGPVIMILLVTTLQVYVQYYKVKDGKEGHLLEMDSIVVAREATKVEKVNKKKGKKR